MRQDVVVLISSELNLNSQSAQALKDKRKCFKLIHKPFGPLQPVASLCQTKKKGVEGIEREEATSSHRVFLSTPRIILIKRQTSTLLDSAGG
jgi:hypothetical protein